jgi:protein gp37
MGLKTKIEYADSTMNFWYGCTKISEGCQNCFAERIYKRFMGKDFSKIIKSKNFDAPLKWKKPKVILVNDMSDFFHEKIDISWITDAFIIMSNCPQHIFLLLTKRTHWLEGFNHWLAGLGYASQFNENIWLGVSVENQKTADERIPELLKIPHFKKWISFEPLLGEIKIPEHQLKQISWAIVGGETGNGARHMKPNWAKILGLRFIMAGIPFFMKQMSNKAPIPKDLMVREYPPEIEEIRNANDS